MAGQTDTQTTIDPETQEEKRVVVSNPFNPEDITRFRVKEEWVFDKQYSTMEVRIIGIAPVAILRTSAGDAVDQAAIFWLYFPAAKPLLAKTEVFNWNNDAAKLTYDDVFMKRLFASYIYKESNVRDLRIQDYLAGKETLVESDKIKNKIIDFEQALWEY